MLAHDPGTVKVCVPVAENVAAVAAVTCETVPEAEVP